MRSLLSRLHRIAWTVGILAYSWPMMVSAQVFNGGGVGAGVTATQGIQGLSRSAPRAVVIRILSTVLSFLALAAVIMIVISGFRLIFSQGEEEQKEKARKTIIYCLIGLVVVLFARILVTIFTQYLPSIV